MEKEVEKVMFIGIDVGKRTDTMLVFLKRAELQ